MFWNLMSMMAATVSCWALSSVGPKTTPRLATVIRFFCWCWATLGVKDQTSKSSSMNNVNITEPHVDLLLLLLLPLFYTRSSNRASLTRTRFTSRASTAAK